jgi:hypothetical protein
MCLFTKLILYVVGCVIGGFIVGHVSALIDEPISSAVALIVGCAVVWASLTAICLAGE